MTIRILVVDSEPRWAQFTKYSLGPLFEVEMAASLQAVLAKLEENSYDVIIVSSSHLDILETIRKNHPNKRVVVATGQETINEAINVFRLGAIDYFVKDYRDEIVCEKIFEAVQRPVAV